MDVLLSTLYTLKEGHIRPPNPTPDDANMGWVALCRPLKSLATAGHFQTMKPGSHSPSCCSASSPHVGFRRKEQSLSLEKQKIWMMGVQDRLKIKGAVVSFNLHSSSVMFKITTHIKYLNNLFFSRWTFAGHDSNVQCTYLIINLCSSNIRKTMDNHFGSI